MSAGVTVGMGRGTRRRRALCLPPGAFDHDVGRRESLYRGQQFIDRGHDRSGYFLVLGREREPYLGTVSIELYVLDDAEGDNIAAEPGIFNRA